MLTNSKSRLPEFLRRSPSSFNLQVLRYLVNGTLISIGYTLTVVSCMEWLKWQSPSISSGISFLIWTFIGYFVHRDFTFRFVGETLLPCIRFFLTIIIRFILSIASVELATSIFGLHYLYGILVNWVILPLITYYLMKLWVFGKDVSKIKKVPVPESRVTG